MSDSTSPKPPAGRYASLVGFLRHRWPLLLIALAVVVPAAVVLIAFRS